MRRKTAVTGIFTLAIAAQADIPLLINHQGFVKAMDPPYGTGAPGNTGVGPFRFGLYDADTTTWLWTNDVNLASVDVSVVRGHGSLRFRYASLANMAAIPFTASPNSTFAQAVLVDAQRMVMEMQSELNTCFDEFNRGSRPRRRERTLPSAEIWGRMATVE